MAISEGKEKKQVVIIGAGGHAKVVANIVLLNGDSILGFLDSVDPSGECLGYPKLGPVESFRDYPDAWFVLAIGLNEARERYAELMEGVKWYTAIHPTAVISPLETEIGEGSVVCANAVVNPCAKIGKHCILNTGAIVEHEDVIGDYVHISVGARLSGKVSIGNRTWVGIGATIMDKISVCGDCMLGAGVVVVRNIEEAGTYVGVPAKKIK